MDGSEGGVVLGIIVTGGRPPLAALGVEEDAALTPFAGKYRFVDFALATLANSGVTGVCVATPGPTPALVERLAHLDHGHPREPRPVLVALPGGFSSRRGRTGRILQALAACQDVIRQVRAETIVVLLADHILQLDLRHLAHAHRELGADLTVAALPVPLDEVGGRIVLGVAGDRCVHEVEREPARPMPAPGTSGFALSWAGDLILGARAVPAVLATASTPTARDDAATLRALAAALRVASFDILDSHLSEAAHRPRPYWHEPTTLEAYYDAHMDLCTPRPALDLYDPAWPFAPAPTGFGPAKVVADAAGRAGQALNALVAEGSLIRGGVVFNTVLGNGVLVDGGAEVEDSVLLDGCRVGRGARVRRALVGPGAVIEDGEEIGFGSVPAAPAHVLPSGLTVVPPAAPPALAVGSGTH